MTLKHHYAREKLTLLLRDLDRYNGDEFWRQMSRIAHGATDHPSAEELLKERDAGLEREAALEAYVERLDKVERERDAALEREASLAAHLEQWDYAIVDAKRCAAYQAFAKEVIANIETLSKQTPSTSLALRDAATIHALSFPTMLRKMWSGGEVQQWIEEQASDKRREAEGGQ